MSIQKQLPHHELGHNSTTRLFGRIVLCMVATPLLLLGIVWLYLLLVHHDPSRREWKTIMLLLWVATLLISFYMVLPRKRPRQGMLIEFPRDPRTDIRQWEDRRTRLILRQVLLESVVVPVVAGALVVAGYRIFGSPLTDRNYSTVTFVVWGSMLALVVRFVFRSWRESIVYRT